VHPGFGNLVLLRVVGRRSGSERALPLGLLTAGGRRYLGHPSGDTPWTLNLRAAESATIESARIPRTRVPDPPWPGPQRDAAVRHLPPASLPGVRCRLAGRHVAATGVFFRLEPTAAVRGRSEPPEGRKPGLTRAHRRRLAPNVPVPAGRSALSGGLTAP
jgi:hypothetical protein